MTKATALPFGYFDKTLCDYQLQGRLKLLQHFRERFECHDAERIGIIKRVWTPSFFRIFRLLTLMCAPPTGLFRGAREGNHPAKGELRGAEDG